MKQKRYLSALLLALVLMAMCPANLRAQSTFSGSGSGTEGDPYKIATAAQLGEFRDLVNAGNSTYNAASVYFVLTDNIDLSSVCHAEDDANSVAEANWTPIGTATNQFKGSFDGQGHSITNMYIHYTTLNQGLFGKTNGATVKNFSISGKMESSTLNVEGSVQCIGGAIGWAYNSTVEDITSSVNIELKEGTTQKLMGGIVGDCDGTTISGCTYTGTLNAGATGDCVGGITGYFRCDARTTKSYQIINCCNAGKVTTTANSNAVAGILGYQNDADFMGIHNCLNLGKIETGASTTGAIYGCYRKNTASVGANNYYKAGSATNGVMNDQSSQSAASVCKSVTVEQLTKGEVCYLLNGKKSTGTLAWYQNLSTPGDATPVLKSTGSNTVYYGYSGCTLTYANSALAATPTHTFVDGVCSVCGAYENEPVKVTAANAESLGLTASYVDYYAITNAAELKWFANVVNNAYDKYKAINVVLTANIENLGAWTPIGTESNPFQGTFNGKNNSITGMTIAYTTSYQGLFGNVSSATLKNFTVGGEMTSSTNGVSEIGGVVGKALASTIENVVSNVNITISGAGIKQSHIAGVVGNCDNTTVSVCTNNGTINAGESTSCIAGIAGYARQTVTIKGCLNTGAISTSGTDAHIAGIIAYCNHGGFKGVSNCLNTGVIDGSSITAGAVFGFYGSEIKSATNNYNYYKVGTASKAIGEGGSEEILKAFDSVSEKQLANGNACYRLNGKTSTGTLTWYQTIGTDNIPVLSSNHQVVYNDGGSYNNPYTVTASNVGYTGGQEASMAFDRSTSTKWCGNSGSGTSIYVEFNTSNAMKVGSYTFTTADDAATYSVRNPKTWVLKGKVNSTDEVWTTIDTQTNSTKMPAKNKTAVTFYLPEATATAYKYFRIEFTHTQNTTFQLSEITLSSAACEHNYDSYHYCSICDTYDATYVKASGTDGTCRWAIYNNTDANYSDGEMVIYPSNGTSGTLANWNTSSDQGWNAQKSLIKSVRFVGNITAQTLAYMFYGCTNLVSVDFTNLITSNVESTYQMFYNCNSLTTINWANVNTAMVTDMSHMFNSCYYLTSLDLSSFNTAKVTNMKYMFMNCIALQTLTLGENFNTALVNNMEGMFDYCSKLTSLDLSKFNTAQVTNMKYMIAECTSLTSLTIGNFDMQKVTNTSSMFNNSTKLKNLTLKAVPYLANGTFNTKFTGAGVAVNYQLDDNSTVYVPTAEKANNLPAATAAPTYSRQMPNEWGTIVAPFAIAYDADNTDYKLYKLTEVTSDVITFTEYADNAVIPAGTPMAIKAIGTKNASSKYDITLTANTNDVNTAITAPDAVSGVTMTGVYAVTEVGNNDYIISQNAFWKASTIKADASYWGTKTADNRHVYVAPFRAYLHTDGTVLNSQMRIGDYSGTTAVNAVDAMISGSAEYYDLSGRRLESMQPGVNIIKYSNGKTMKVVLEEGSEPVQEVRSNAAATPQTRNMVQEESIAEPAVITVESGAETMWGE